MCKYILGINIYVQSDWKYLKPNAVPSTIILSMWARNFGLLLKLGGLAVVRESSGLHLLKRFRQNCGDTV